MCHAIVDTWLGDVGRHIHFVASVIASVATLELVADVSIDECVFECDLPPGYARSTANKPWEDGSLLIGALDLSLVSPRSAHPRRGEPAIQGTDAEAQALVVEVVGEPAIQGTDPVLLGLRRRPGIVRADGAGRGVLHGLRHRSDCRSARPARGP